jgi:hypothetical protein
MSCSPTSTTAIGTFTRSPKNAVTMIYAPLRGSPTRRFTLCAARERTLGDTVSPSLLLRMSQVLMIPVAFP